jgi:hypothetical protein
MTPQRITDMTVEELHSLIEQVVDQRLREISRPQSSRSLREVLDSVDRHRWTPPPGAKSSLELLREDRDS